MRATTIGIILILLLATAHAATTNVGSSVLRTTHVLAEGRASFGSLANLSEYDLFVSNDTLFGGAIYANSTLQTDGKILTNDSLSVAQDAYVGNAHRVNGTLFVVGNSTLGGFTEVTRNGNQDLLRLTDSSVNGRRYMASILHPSLILSSDVNDGTDSRTLLTFNGATGVTSVTGSLDTTETLTAGGNGYFDGNVRFNTSVGIGTDPSNPLHIASSTPSLRIQTTGGTNNPDYTITTNEAENSFIIGRTGVANDFRLLNGNAVINAGLEIDGALNHDGSTVGFYGNTPVTQATGPGQITDSTGGTSSATCAAIAAGAIYSQTDMDRVKDCLASLLARINALEQALDDLGLIT